jgi:hypothetical protein
MRKLVFTMVMLLAVLGAIAGSVPQTEAAQSTCLNPGPNCRCQCQCGQLYKCCTSGGITTCEPTYDPNLLCPQIAC